MQVNSTKLGREYVIDGKTYYSVTTILKVVSLPHLALWEARIGKGAARTIARKAGNYGTTVHGYFEKILSGEKLDYNHILKKFHKDVKALEDLD